MKITIKKLLHRKKGVAIELAILVMLVVVSLSALLVTVNILNKKASNSLSVSVNERLYLDQIGESFVTAVKDSQDLDAWRHSVRDYSAIINGNTELTLVDGQGNTKLSVKLENYLNRYKIIQWKYN